MSCLRARLAGHLAILLGLAALAGCAADSPGQGGAGTGTGRGPTGKALRAAVSEADYAVDFRITGDWGSGFGAEVKIRNTGSSTLSDWVLEFDFPYSITTIWNARVQSRSGSRYAIAAESWNGTLQPGGEVSFGFNGEPGNVAALPTSFFLSAQGPAPAPSPAPSPTPSPTASPAPGPTPSPTASPAAQAPVLQYRTSSDWGSGFQGEITIYNPGPVALTRWTLAFDLPATLSSIWNASVAGRSGQRYTVTPASWNSRIEPGATISVGFVAAPGNTPGATGLAFTSDQVTVSPGEDSGGTADSGGDGSGGSGGGSGGSGDGSGGDGSGGSGDGSSGGGSGGSGGSAPGRRFVAYFPEWGIYQRGYQVADIPARHLDVVNYAFADISPQGEVIPYDTWAAIEKPFPGDTWDQPLRGNYNQLLQLKARYPHLITMISVGGWTLSGRFSDVALTADSRRLFARSAVSFIKRYGFDGVDIDWEYPVAGGLPGNTYRPEDRQNYTLLLAELRAQLDAQEALDGRQYYLSAATPAGYDKYANIELDKIGAILDWINVMTYDFHGGWESQTNHHSALYRNPSDPGHPAYHSDHALRDYLAAGVPAAKLLLGFPAYGRSWSGVPARDNGLFQPATGVPRGTWDDTGMFDYWDIVGRLADSPGSYLRYWDSAARSPYVYAPGQGTFITYEDVESLQHRLQYIDSLGLGGLMMWELSGDVRDPADPRSLVGAVARAFSTSP
jgi:chitinase